MTSISFAFSPRVCEDRGRICSRSQLSPTGLLRSTSSPLPRTETRISCAAQCRKKNLSIRLMTSRVLCVCVSLLFLSITITGEVWTTLPCSSAQACVAAMRTGGVRMCQEEVVLLLLFITHTRAVTALFVLHAFTYFILLICTHQSLQQLSGNPLVRGSMHVGVWEDSPGCRRWNTNAAPRKPWRMAVSCCRC